MRRVNWTAVAAALAVVIALVMSLAWHTDNAVVVALCAIALAILSFRE